MTDFTIVGSSAVTPNFTDARWLPVIHRADGLEVSFQAHHIIPTAVAQQSELMSALQNSGLFDWQSFSDNGIPLAASGGEAEILGLTAHHRGPHAAYNSFFEHIIDTLEQDWVASGSPTSNLDEYSARIRGVVSHLQAEFNTPGTNYQLYQNTDFWNTEAGLFDPDTLDFGPGSAIGSGDLYQSGGLRSDGSRLTVDDILPWSGNPDSGDFVSTNSIEVFSGRQLDVSPSNVQRFEVSADNRWAVLLRSIEENIAIDGSAVNRVAGAIDILGKVGTIADPLELGWTLYQAEQLNQTDPEAAQDLIADYVGGTAGGALGWWAGASAVALFTPEPVSTALGTAGMFVLSIVGGATMSLAGDTAGEATVGALLDYLQDELANGGEVTLDHLVSLVAGLPLDDSGVITESSAVSNDILNIFQGQNVYLGNGTNEEFIASSGDVIYGSFGVDTIVIDGQSSNFAGSSLINGGISISNFVNGEKFTLHEVERIRFNDTTTDQFLRPIGTVSLVSGLGGEAGFGENVLPANDDGSTGEIDLTSIFEEGLNFFGREFTSLWVNNNGSVTFNGPRRTFTPTVITENNGNPEITPFFADVDTNGGATDASSGGNSTGSNLVYYDFDAINDRFIVTWDDVGYFNSQTDLTNAFQLIMTDRGGGNFDIEYRYENVEWTTGNSSGGSGGLGGTPARAGYTASTGDPAAYFELSASGNQDALLALDEMEGNTGQVGRWFFSVRSGEIVSADIPALPDIGVNGWTAGDPHLLTLDGVPYDFHAAGEYVLLRATNDSNFEIQSRMTPVGESVSVNAAIGIRAENGSAIMIDSDDASPVSVDGVTVEVENFGFVTVGNDRIYREDDSYTVLFAGVDGVVNAGDSRVIVDVHNDRVDLDIRLNTDLAGALEGLLGNANGNPDDDIFLADGTVLDRPLAFEDLYGQYRDDWRVTTSDQSLFSYEEGESLEDFYLPDYPGGLISISDFTAEEIATAEEVATNAGLSETSINFSNAVLDFLLTGDTSFIDAAADVALVVATATPGLEVPENLELDGAAGDDVITGAAGNDVLRGYAGNDVISGGFGRDVLSDGLGNNILHGEGGSDNILSLSGINELSGGGGSDLMIGGIQADAISGGSGNDIIRGEAGNGFLGGSDVITGGTGDDIMMGGRGADTFVFNEGDGADIIGSFHQADVSFNNMDGHTVDATGADFQSNVDHIQLVGFETVDATNVMDAVMQGDDGAVFSAEGTSITFFNVSADQLSSDDFVFV